jgi:hypothetical protein
MGFDPYNHSLKIRESIKTQSPKVGALGSVKVHSLTLSCTHGRIKCVFRASLLSCTDKTSHCPLHVLDKAKRRLCSVLHGSGAALNLFQ